MKKRIIMIMGVQRSGTTALFDAFDVEGVTSFQEKLNDLLYDDYYLRPEPVIHEILHLAPGTVLLKPISETMRRNVSDVLCEYEAYDLSVVWIYRDPVNVFHSMEREGWTLVKDDALKLTREWNKRNRSMLECLPEQADRITVVRYEDLVTSPEALQALGRFLGIPVKGVFRKDSRAGRQAVPADFQTVIDGETRETLAMLDAARTFLPPAWVAPEEFTAGDFRDDPYTCLREWRKAGPLHRLRQPNSWLVLDYDDVAACLNDGDRFSLDLFKDMGGSILRDGEAGYRRIRSLQDPHYTPAQVERHRVRIEECSRRMLGLLRHSSEFDFMVCAPELGKILHWQWLESWKAAAACPMSANGQTDRLTPEEIADLCRFVPVSGALLASFLGSVIHYLLQNSAAEAGLRAQPDLLPAYLEEWLRLYTPAIAAARTLHGELEIAGVKLPAGSQVYLGLASANRDPRKFEKPDEFILNRRGPPHLGFGAGAHQCVGVSLARLECEAILRILLTEFPPLRALDPAAKTAFGGAPFNHGPRSLLVRFERG